MAQKLVKIKSELIWEIFLDKSDEDICDQWKNSQCKFEW